MFLAFSHRSLKVTCRVLRTIDSRLPTRILIYMPGVIGTKVVPYREPPRQSAI
jgi:hypothetical protein